VSATRRHLLRHPLLTLGLPTTVLALGAWPAAAMAASGISPTPPHIVAKPVDVMVNQTVHLTGTGFPPSTAIALQECSETSWIVGQNPCLTNNQKTIQTNSLGGFQTTMTAGICPGPTSPPQTRRTCYIGEPKPSGVDTIKLMGAAKIVVSWP
jgi:hypothetical protein